jgi:predicted dehydrogenase
VLRGLPGVEVAVAELDPSRRAAAAAALPDVEIVGDMSQFLPDVDAIVVATQVGRHHELALAALNAGKHVLVEKPLAASSRQCEELISAADDAGVHLMVGHTFEYNPAVHKLRDIVQSGELGDVLYIDAARLNLGIYQPDINVVWDLAPHDISILNFLLGTTPTSVSSWGRANARAGREDVAYLHLEYEEIAAYIRVSWLDPCKVRRVTVVGRDKMVVYNDLAPVERIRIYDSSVRANPCDGEQDMPMTYHYGDIVTPYVAFEEPLAVQDRHFIECLRFGTTPMTDGVTGLAVVRVLEAASAALAERTRVPIADGRLAVP